MTACDTYEGVTEYVVVEGDTCFNLANDGRPLEGLSPSDLWVCPQNPGGPGGAPTNPCGEDLAIDDTIFPCPAGGALASCPNVPTPAPTESPTLSPTDDPCDTAPPTYIVQTGDSCGSLRDRFNLQFDQITICRIEQWNEPDMIETCGSVEPGESQELAFRDELYPCTDESFVCPIPNRDVDQFGRDGTVLSRTEYNEDCGEPELLDGGKCKNVYDECVAVDDCRAEYNDIRNTNDSPFRGLDQDAVIETCQDIRDVFAANSTTLEFADLFACLCQAGCIAPIVNTDDSLLWGLASWEIAVIVTFMVVGGWVGGTAAYIWWKKHRADSEKKLLDQEITELEREKSNSKHY